MDTAQININIVHVQFIIKNKSSWELTQYWNEWNKK